MIATLLAALALGVPAPPAAGPWYPLGSKVVSRPAKSIHFFRTALSPHALGVVATSTSPLPIRVYWSTYCEFESDDANVEEHQQTLTGVHRIVAYPSVFDGATRCYVSVNVSGRGRAVVAAAVFSN